MWLRSDHVEVLDRVWPSWMPLAAIERDHDFMDHVEALERLFNLEVVGLVECDRSGLSLLDYRFRITDAGIHAALENAGRVL